jgi:hypothetical protein
MAAEWMRGNLTNVEPDTLGNRIDQYAQFLVSFSSEPGGESTEMLSEATGLPPQQIANALLRGKRKHPTFSPFLS